MCERDRDVVESLEQTATNVIVQRKVRLDTAAGDGALLHVDRDHRRGIAFDRAQEPFAFRRGKLNRGTFGKSRPKTKKKTIQETRPRRPKR